MAKITRYNGNLKAFASESQGTERTIYGDVAQSDDLTDNINADYLRGLAAGLDAAGQPTEEDFNGALFTVSQLSAYLHQMGVAEWSGSQEYHVGSIVNRAGVLYVCKTNNLVNATVPESDSVNWGKGGTGDFVALTGNQTIAGVKTFSSSPIVPNATTATQAMAFGQVNVANSAPIKTALNASGDAPIYACRAWVNFNGTGTVAIRASGNVSSITDNGVGDYTVNFTTAMTDDNYSVSSILRNNITNYSRMVTCTIKHNVSPTTQGFRVDTGWGDDNNSEFRNADCDYVCLSILG